MRRTRSDAAPLVLIVDSDPDATEILTLILTDAGYRTECAENVEIAVEKALEECPTVIMTDLFGQGGPDALQKLRQEARCEAVPVIMVTTDFGVTVPSAVPTDLGVAAVLRRPLDLQEVLAVVKVAAGGSKGVTPSAS